MLDNRHEGLGRKEARSGVQHRDGFLPSMFPDGPVYEDLVRTIAIARSAVRPGPDGQALIANARQRWPVVCAVLISGTDMEMPALGLGHCFLDKPVHVDAPAHNISELAAWQDGV